MHEGGEGGVSALGRQCPVPRVTQIALGYALLRWAVLPC